MPHNYHRCAKPLGKGVGGWGREKRMGDREKRVKMKICMTFLCLISNGGLGLGDILEVLFS